MGLRIIPDEQCARSGWKNPHPPVPADHHPIPPTRGDGGQPHHPQAMFGFHTVQGVLEPLTPLGQDLLKLVLTGGGQVFKLYHTIETQTAFYSSAQRLWINFTPLLQSPIGRKIFPRIIQAIDPGVAAAVRELAADPRFTPTSPFPSPKTFRRLVGFLLPILRRVFQALRYPDRSREIAFRAIDAEIAKAHVGLATSGDIWINFSKKVERLLAARTLFSDFVIPELIPLVVAGMAPFFGILERFNGQAAEAACDSDLNRLHLEIARGLENNVTTEMDLQLWQMAQTLTADPDSVQVFAETTASNLAAGYLGGNLPPKAQDIIETFLAHYGARGLGEIDLGRERWGDDPTHIMQILQSYLKIKDPTMAPNAVYNRGVKSAEEAAQKLIAAVRTLPGGSLKAHLVRFAIDRYRSLGGMRETPKFFAIRMMGLIRQGLISSGIDFVAKGYLNHTDDLFFLEIREIEQAIQAKTFSPENLNSIRIHREIRRREMLRTQIPRVLLSDCTAFYRGFTPADDDPDALVGDPVSPGIGTGVVRVVLDPHQTQLQPGEILVCPGTDPAWTPLFLAAGGLVMEVSGMMTHGSVVARDYGIPAVVGVTQATIRLKTGQRIRINGNNGKITILE